MAEFVIPEFLSSQTTDAIHGSMMDNLPDDIDIAEGSFAWDYTRPGAIEISKVCQYDLPQIIKCIFPQYAEEIWLDYHAANRGLTRKGAEPAYVTVTFNTTVGVTIAAGKVVRSAATDDTPSVEFEVITTITTTGESTDVECVATTPGIEGNVPANSIIILDTPQTGVLSITNAADAHGGKTTEDDDTLRARVEEYDQNQDISFVGSEADYVRWAKQLLGVGTVKVISPADDSGLITMLITDTDGNPANSTILNAVYTYIMKPTDTANRLAPVGALLSVIAPTALNITITATIERNVAYTNTEVKNAFIAAVKSYYPQAIAEAEIKYSKIGAILSETLGVTDYSTLRINAGVINIAIPANQIPLTISVVLSE